MRPRPQALRRIAALALLRKPDRILRHCCRMLETDLTQTEILLEQA
jgi:hypothetical protein